MTPSEIGFMLLGAIIGGALGVFIMALLAASKEE